jgi:hypothetical protein
MPASDSNYASVTRHTRRPLSKASRPVVLEVVDEAWAADKLSDDEVEIARHEAAVAPLLEEGELDADAIVVSPTGNSASAANNGEFSILGGDFAWYTDMVLTDRYRQQFIL